MKLSDVVGNAGLAGYAEVALILFLFAFLLVAARVLFAPRRDLERDARLPFDDEASTREGDSR